MKEIEQIINIIYPLSIDSKRDSIRDLLLHLYNKDVGLIQFLDKIISNISKNDVLTYKGLFNLLMSYYNREILDYYKTKAALKFVTNNENRVN